MVAIQDRTDILDMLHARARDIQGVVSAPTLISVTQPVWAADALQLFARGRELGVDRVFWAQPDHTLRVGVAVTWTCDSVGATRFEQTSTAWQSLIADAQIDNPDDKGGPLLFGGFAFDPQRESTPRWDGYPDGRMVLPQLMFTFVGDAAWLTSNLIVQPDTHLEDEIQKMQAVLDHLLAESELSLGSPVTILSTEESRHPWEWQADVAHIVEAIRRGELEKAVLARAIRLCADSPFDEVQALERLMRDYTDCTIFAIQRGDRCFLGATPERLVQVRGQQVKTMVLAGTTRRGATPEEDRQLGRELLDSAKNRHEHAVVLQTIAGALSTVIDNLQFENTPQLLKLGNVQHLCTPITGELANGTTLMEIVGRLHPTPAVGGHPREIALQLIREREMMDRGWYAGAVGWLDAHGEGEFVVALRSALLHGNEAILFAGCGIMADSDPAKEYQESRLKFRPMLSALGAI